MRRRYTLSITDAERLNLRSTLGERISRVSATAKRLRGDGFNLSAACLDEEAEAMRALWNRLSRGALPREDGS